MEQNPTMSSFVVRVARVRHPQFLQAWATLHDRSVVQVGTC